MQNGRNWYQLDKPANVRVTQIIFRYFRVVSGGCIYISTSISPAIRDFVKRRLIKTNWTIKSVALFLTVRRSPRRIKLLCSSFTDGKTVADGSRPWSNLQDTLGDCTQRPVRGVCFIADGRDAREASVGLMRGKIPTDVISCARNTKITFAFLTNTRVSLPLMQV